MAEKTALLWSWGVRRWVRETPLSRRAFQLSYMRERSDPTFTDWEAVLWYMQCNPEIVALRAYFIRDVRTPIICVYRRICGEKADEKGRHALEGSQPGICKNEFEAGNWPRDDGRIGIDTIGT